MNKELDFSHIELDEGQSFRNVSGADIMKYYTPRWLAIVGLIASVVAAV